MSERRREKGGKQGRKEERKKGRKEGRKEQRSRTHDRTVLLPFTPPHSLGTFNHERVAEIANKVLEPIWPYPVCDDNDKSNGTECTSFPLSPMSTGEAEVILGKIPSRYMCNWGVAHTIAE